MGNDIPIADPERLNLEEEEDFVVARPALAEDGRWARFHDKEAVGKTMRIGLGANGKTLQALEEVGTPLAQNVTFPDQRAAARRTHRFALRRLALRRCRHFALSIN
jgi:hypothetical protein